MAERNINLATFNFDLSGIEKQIIENRKQIEAFSAALAVNKKALNEDKKTILEYGKTLSALEKFQEEVNEEFTKGTISAEEYAEATQMIKQEADKTKDSIKELASAQSGHIKTIIEQERQVSELRQSNAELNKLLAGNRTEIVGNEGAYRDLNKELNALKIESKNLGAQLVKLRMDGKENTEEYRRLEEQWEKVSEKADALNDEFKALDKAVGDNQRSVGDYTDSIKKAFADLPELLRSGDVLGSVNAIKGMTEDVQGAAKSMVTGLKTAFQSLWAAIAANPILVTLGAIVVAVGAYVKEMWEYNQEIRVLNREVEQLAQTSGEATDALRKNASALSETFGGEFQERVRELNSLMKDFGITSDEAFKIYTEGLARGGVLNDEFAESVREYGPLLADAGYSAQEFINILNAGIELDIYNDKLPDAIKEGYLSLKEQTKATRDALVNAFGAPFTDELLIRIQHGKTTVAKGLDEIARKAEEANLNQQQLAQITADVFRGAGEDAGGAVKIFEALNKAQEYTIDNMTELQRQTVTLAELNKDLAEAKDEAFKSDSVIAFQADVEKAWKYIQIGWYNSLAAIQKFLGDAMKGFQLAFMNVRDAITSIPTMFANVLRGMRGDMLQFAEIARTAGDIIRAAFAFDVDGLGKGIDALIGKVKNFQSQTQKAITENRETLGGINSRNVGSINAREQAKVESERAARAQVEKNKNKTVTGAVGEARAKDDADGKKSADARVRAAEQARKEQERLIKEQQRLAEQEARDRLAQLKKSADLAVNIAKNELANHIAVNAEKLKSDQRYNQDRYNSELEYFKKLKQLRDEELRLEEEKAKVGIKDQQEIDAIAEEFRIKRLENETDYNQKIGDISKKFREQQREDERLSREIEFQQRIIDLEEQGGQEFAIRQAQAEEERRVNMEKLEEDYANQLISFENFEAQKSLIEQQYAEKEKRIRQAVEDSKLQAIANTLGQAAGLFEENTAAYKALSIAQATINTYLGVSRLLAEYPGPIGWIMSAAQIAQGLAMVLKIAGVNASPKKAARGMKINGPSHSAGGVKMMTPSGMIEAEGGEVIINKRSAQMFAPQLSAINMAGGGVPLFARGGVVPSNVASNQNIFKESIDSEMLAETLRIAVAKGAAEGTHSGSQRGISELSESKMIMENSKI
ncbi:Chromosome segregation ATPase [Cruoricaptor ignavus]|uniref:Chromosome segregation ATPase n=1 Tax=Cruoricaptor ignavus TaxID=1118202 RepID=A0A1M6HE46_9FLAO|nr:phage tail tape measure protein [Cruoricaptor ignavus]SHJ20465.1 Chromosome segregation ATPase [Cruoricaptor ignavus]